jgi:hypothetical protein
MTGVEVVVTVVDVVGPDDVVTWVVGWVVVDEVVTTDVVVGVVAVDVDVALLQDASIADTASKQLSINQMVFLGIISLLFLFFIRGR